MATVRQLLRDPKSARKRDGYLDTLNENGVEPKGASQRLMQSTVLPLVYERLWRPVGARLLVAGRSPADEERITSELLSLRSGDRVLDIACGPGNTSRRLLPEVGDGGMVVGLDASETMLARAVADTGDKRITYVRGDATQLPFKDASFDAVCCYAALYLIDDPLATIDEIVRVLAPGGRVAILTSCYRGPLPMRLGTRLLTGPGGVHMFDRDEFTEAFEFQGLEDVRQQIHGFAQFVGARKPGRRPKRS